MASEWTPKSWRTRSVKQAPHYDDQIALNEVEEEINSFPPLVMFAEIDQLRRDLREVAEGRAFLLQGGDCAESFSEFKAVSIRNTVRVLSRMAGILNVEGHKKIVRMGRIAGQFAKPRTLEFETRDGVSLPSYRGDIINGHDFDQKARTPDPTRMIQAYYHSAATLNFLRSYRDENLENLEWNVFSEKVVRPKIGSGRFAGEGLSCYTSHEALLLYYEEFLTRKDRALGTFYDTSGHFLWLGDRTRDLEGAHVEFLRGVKNPVGIKCGPNLEADELLKLIEVLNPSDEVGRITLISRMGRGRVDERLRPLLRAVKNQGLSVIWSCDPMHGNTKGAVTGQKTRYFDDILSELFDFFRVCKEEGVYPGGIHLEMTGEAVTECLGGGRMFDINENYQTLCDPRLNGEQSLELAFKISEHLGAARIGAGELGKGHIEMGEEAIAKR